MWASSVSPQETTNPFGIVSKFATFVLDRSCKLNSTNFASDNFLSNHLCVYGLGKKGYAGQKKLCLNAKGGSSSTIRRVLIHFNRAIRLHCEKIPLGFASIGAGSVESKGSNEDGNGVLEDEGMPNNGIETYAPKNVLILMSDTGGGHRASAEAIKAAFHEAFGDKYQVNLQF